VDGALHDLIGGRSDGSAILESSAVEDGGLSSALSLRQFFYLDDGEIPVVDSRSSWFN